MRFNLQFLQGSRVERKGGGIVAFIKIQIHARACVRVNVCGIAFYPIFHLCGRLFDFETSRKPTAADRCTDSPLKGKHDQSTVNACKRASEITPST